MTDFSLPPFVLPYGGWWIEVDLEGDLHAWAQRSAEEVLTRWDVRNGRRIGKMTKMLESVGGVVREKSVGAIVALLLYPTLGEGVRATVAVRPVDMSGRSEDEAPDVLLHGLMPPSLAADLSPEISAIETQAGTCQRVRFEQPTQGGGAVVVSEQLAYLWTFPQYGAGIVMSTAFQSLAEAGRWRSALDDLAAAAKLTA